jgi:hypothetical protein
VVPVNTCRVPLRYALFRVGRYDVDYHACEAGLVDFIEARGSAKPDVADPARIGMPCFRRRERGSTACPGHCAAPPSECPALRRALYWEGLAAARRRGKKLGGHNAQSDKTAAEATAFAEQMRPILAPNGFRTGARARSCSPLWTFVNAGVI